MGLIIIDPPAKLPIDLEQAQRQARTVQLGSSDPDVDMFTDVWMPAAVARAESFQRRSYITTQYRATYDYCWPCPIYLPRNPVQSVDAVEYVDTDGVVQTLDPSQYQAVLDEAPARIVPAFSVTWPAARSELQTVRVTFTAGYGDDAADVPANAIAAMLIICASLYENREEVVVGTIVSEMPKSAEYLLWPDRVWIPEQ